VNGVSSLDVVSSAETKTNTTCKQTEEFFYTNAWALPDDLHDELVGWAWENVPGIPPPSEEEEVEKKPVAVGLCWPNSQIGARKRRG
jgi:hypothetical protein